MKLLTGKLAVKLAKDSNDPLSTKYVRLRKKYFDVKEKINIKYGRRAKALVKQKVRESR